MKRFISFLCAVLVLSLVWACLAENGWRERWKRDEERITTYHELWGIPWGTSVDEFLDKVQELYGFPFAVFYQRDTSVPITYSSFDSGYEALSDDPICLFGYPVNIYAEFAYSPVRTEGEWPTYLVAEPDGHWILRSIEFWFQIPPDSALAAWFMADNVFQQLCLQYGEPFAAYCVPWSLFERYPDHSISMPITNKRIDIPKLVEKGLDEQRFYAHFDNAVYDFRVNQDIAEYGAHITLTFFAPTWSERVYPEFGLSSIRPFEEFDERNYEYSYYTPAPSPTLQPHIEIGLW